MDDHENFKQDEGKGRRKRLRRLHLQVDLSSQVKAEINGKVLQAESTKNPLKKAKYISSISQLEAADKVKYSPNPTLMNLDPLAEASHVGFAVTDTSDNHSSSQVISELMSQESYMVKPISRYQQGIRAVQLWQDNYCPLTIVLSVMVGIMNQNNEESPWLQVAALLVMVAGPAFSIAILLQADGSEIVSKAKQFFRDVATVTITVALICILVMICGLQFWLPLSLVVVHTLYCKLFRTFMIKRRAIQRQPHTDIENRHAQDHGIIMILGMANIWTQDYTGITEKGGKDIRVAATVAAALSMLYPQVARWWPKLSQYIQDSDVAAATFLLFLVSGFAPCQKILRSTRPFIRFLPNCLLLFLTLCLWIMLSIHSGERRIKPNVGSLLIFLGWLQAQFRFNLTLRIKRWWKRLHRCIPSKTSAAKRKEKKEKKKK